MFLHTNSSEPSPEVLESAHIQEKEAGIQTFDVPLLIKVPYHGSISLEALKALVLMTSWI